MQPDIPDTTLLTMSAAEYVAKMDMAKQDATRQAADELNALRDNLRNALQIGETDNPVVAVTALVTENGNLKRERAAQDNEIVQLQKSITTLTAQIAELTKPQPPEIEPPDMPDTQPIITPTDPVTVPVPKPLPAAVKPVISRADLRNICGVTITKDDTPSTRQDDMTRQLIDLCAGMGFNVWRGLLNYEEIRSTFSLPAYGRDRGMEFMADSVDTQVKRLNDDELVRYCAALKKHWTRAVYFNDVDADDKAGVIHDWVKRARAAMLKADFDVPLIGSFMGNFDRSKYPGFDFYEIQTFGRPTELKTFLARQDVDVFCLDGQKSEVVSELKASSNITLAANVPNFFVYTAFDYAGTDWRKQPETVTEIKDFVSRWKAQRPQPVL